MDAPQRFSVAVGFAIQTVVGAVCFVVVLLVASSIAWIIGALEQWLGLPHWLSIGAQVVEKAIFCADVFVFGLLILSETLKFAPVPSGGSGMTAKRKAHTVVIDREFVRDEATSAVRTFFRPVFGAYNFVRRTSDPDSGHYSASKVAPQKQKHAR